MPVEKTKANWAELGAFISSIAAVVGVIIVGVKAWTYESKLADVQTKLGQVQTRQAEVQTGLNHFQTNLTKVQTKLRELDVQEALEGNLQLVASIGPSPSATIGKVRTVPLLVELSNLGRSPVGVKEVEVVVYKGELEDYWSRRLKEQRDRDHPPVTFGQKPPPPRATPVGYLVLGVGMVGPNSAKSWSRIPMNNTSVYKPSSKLDGMVQKSQNRSFQLNFLVNDGDEPQILKFEVTAKTDSGIRTAVAWIGTGPFDAVSRSVSFAPCTAYASTSQCTPYAPMNSSIPMTLVPKK